MNFNKALSITAAAAMAVSVAAVSVSAADPVTVELNSSYTGDWSSSAKIEKVNFDGFSGDVKVVLQVETVNVKDGNTYIIKPMDVDKSWDAITSKLTAEKAVCKPDGFMQIRADQTEVEFVVPQDVVADLWNGGIAFQVSNVIVKSATLSDGSPENALTIVSDKDTPDYCAGKFDPWAVAEEAPTEETTAEVPAETTEETTVETTVEEQVEEEVEETVEEDVVDEEEVEEEIEEEVYEDEAEEDTVELDGLELTQVGGEGSSNNWGQAVVMYTYNNIEEGEEPGENPFDESLLNEDNMIVVYYESDVAPELILQSWSGGASWAKVPQNEELSQPGVAVFTYDYMTAMYESDDFSTLDAVNIGDQGAELNVLGVYVASSSDAEAAPVEEEAEVTVEADTATDDAAAPEADVAETTVPKTGNAGLAAIAGVIAVAGAAAVTFRKRK